jgi:dTDP-4-dehydrorhamnose reductase
VNTLIVGSGFVGRALAQHLTGSGESAVLASRTPPEAARGEAAQEWIRLDITEPGAFGRALERTGADSVVLVHGPSDVTWCERHPEEAMNGHAGAARLVTEAADGRRTVLISTDNVFDGTADAPDESAPTRPANAYGRAKLAAEEILAEGAETTVLRVSLIYGWEPADSAKWLNFFASCVHGLRAGRQIRVPFDQWTTPVLIDDVARVTAALASAASVPPLLHLGGPERISRAEWAGVIASQLGVPADLVVPEPRVQGRYANRPVSTCLSSRLLAGHPATAGLTLRSVSDGSRLLLDRSPSPITRSTV